MAGYDTAQDHAPDPLARPGEHQRLWHNRAFLLLWGGRSVSALGSSASGIAFPLLILGLTHSAAWAGFAGGLAALPPALLGLPAGVVVDRLNPKRLMMACDGVRALAQASIPVAMILSHLSLAQVYGVVVLGGAMLVFYNTAMLAVLPRVVPEDQLAVASAQSEGAFYTVGLIGPSVGGILYALARLLPFALDATSYVVSILSLLLLQRDVRRPQPVVASSFREDMRAGLSWFWHHRLIRSLSLLESGETILLSATPLLVIVLARGHHASPGAIGLALSLGAGGGIAGAMATRSIQRRLGFAPIAIGVPWVRVILYPFYLVAPDPITLGLITAGLSFLNPVRNATLFRYVVPVIPDHIRGRIMALWDLFPSVTSVVGAPLVGLGLQMVGAGVTIGVVAGIALVLALLTTGTRAIRSAQSTG